MLVAAGLGARSGLASCAFANGAYPLDDTWSAGSTPTLNPHWLQPGNTPTSKQIAVPLFVATRCSAAAGQPMRKATPVSPITHQAGRTRSTRQLPVEVAQQIPHRAHDAPADIAGGGQPPSSRHDAGDQRSPPPSPSSKYTASSSSPTRHVERAGEPLTVRGCARRSLTEHSRRAISDTIDAGQPSRLVDDKQLGIAAYIRAAVNVGRRAPIRPRCRSAGPATRRTATSGCRSHP